ncbi:hypothetical protein WA158_006427 [Blastocystis sp. Blastoise]
MSSVTRVELPLPDDFHVHLRDGDAMASLANRPTYYKRFLVMPNLSPDPVTTTEKAMAYKERISKNLPKDSKLELLMTLYLTNSTTPEEIEKASKSGIIYACKLYPAGATTNSSYGVTDFHSLYPVFSKMEEVGMHLCIHGEIPDNSLDIFDREHEFIQTILLPLLEAFPRLSITMEHITTKEAVDIILNHNNGNLYGSITPQHLMYTRNDLLVGGIKPHLYCLPILKTKVDREALIRAIQSGSKYFYLGTDSAPHAINKKETKCGCAGCFTSPISMSLYTTIFEEHNCLDNLKAFCCENGADCFKVPRNQGKIVLTKEEWACPENYIFGDSIVVPLEAGKKLSWKITVEEN